MTRTETTSILRDATISYWAHKNYSCYSEIAVNSWGKLRADVLSLNMKGLIVLSEIKSSRSDYLTDCKWKSYLPFCDRMFFVMTPKTFASIKMQLVLDIKGTGVGVMVLDPTTGYLKSVISSKAQQLEDEIRQKLIIRMAWRNGQSRRTHRRRVRHFL